MRQHKLASLVALLLVFGFLALVIPEALSAGKLKITDSTSCTAWSSARPKQWDAYARRYIRLHRTLPTGAATLAGVKAAVNYGCTRAYSFDEADSITVLQAIRGQY